MPENRVLAVVLGGGQGARLYPLTKVRSKPAVPIAGKYRLIDIPLSNCLHSGIDTVYVLTQFNSASLHRHILRTYRFDAFDRGFIEILAAEQTPESIDWFQGTADAVRRSLRYIDDPAFDWVLILSGDHLYRMDYRHFLKEHIDRGDDVTLACKPVDEDQATALGVLSADADGRVSGFAEKPPRGEALEALRLEGEPPERSFLASMGVYLFRREVLVEMLQSGDEEDFGREIIPRATQEYNVGMHKFDSYWRDIGTIRSFLEANVELTSPMPEFNFYEPDRPVYTRPRFLPSSKISDCHLCRTILADGSIVTDANIEDSIIGIRSMISEGVTIRRSLVMGADYYEDQIRDSVVGTGAPELGIGPECIIEDAIIDKNARVGAGSKIVNARKKTDEVADLYVISDGVVVIPKDTVIPPGTII